MNDSLTSAGPDKPATRRPAGVLHFPWFLFLAGVLPVVHFYEANFRSLLLQDLVRPVLLAVLMVGMLWVAARLVWRRAGQAAVVLAPLIAVLVRGHGLGGWLSLVLLLASVGFGAGFKLRRVPGRGPWTARIVLPLNVVLLTLVVLPMAAVWRADLRDNQPVPGEFFRSEIQLPAAAATGPRPDIYFLLMDGLGQPAYVESHFDLDAELYSRPLARRGFQVLRHSFSNYPQTGLSAAATLNLGPVDRVLDIPDPQSRDRRVLEQVVGDSRAVRALRRLGYDLVAFPSGYPLTRLKGARNRTPTLNPSFTEYHLIRGGALPLMLGLLGCGPADVSYAMRRGRLEYIFDQLPTARRGISDDKPVFVFAHILAPHPPFVFDAEGQAVTSRRVFSFGDGTHWLRLHGREDRSYRRRYAAQATYIMRRLAETVDAIIAASPRPPVIIVQSDHGPGSALFWEKPAATDHNERFGIFNAWYAPPGTRLGVYEGMTSLNTFPVLFNALFGANLPAQPDAHWFSRWSRPYDFIPVEKHGADGLNSILGVEKRD